MPGAALALALTLAHARSAPQQTLTPHAMVMVAAPNVEVMIARRVDDGTLETACVDNDDAAKAFFAGAKSKSRKPELK
jgi:hypothetical protein